MTNLFNQNNTKKISITDVLIGVLANIVSIVPLAMLSGLATPTIILVAVNVFFIAVVTSAFYRYQKKIKLFNYLGLIEILDGKSKPSFKEYGKIPIGDFYFWGISAKRIIATREIQKKLIEIGNSKNDHKIKFLLLNPDCSNLERKALDEGADPEIWKIEIPAAIKSIQHIAKQNNIDIEVRVYDEFPTWRLIIINNKLMHASYYLTGKRGNEHPIFVLSDENDDALFNAFFNEFQDVWNYRSQEYK